MAKRKANGALTKITTRAKAIYKNGGTWKAAIKKAGVDYRAGKLGAVKLIEKGEKKSTRAKKVYRVKRTAKGRYKGTSRVGRVDTRQQPPIFGGARLSMVNGIGALKFNAASAKSALINNAKFLLSGALLRRDIAKTKREKNKLGKLVSKYRSQLKKYSS